MLLLATCPHSAVAQTNTFPASGNAGVGTTTPTNPLQVTNGSGTSAGVRVDAVTATTGNGGALVLNTPSGSNHLIFETTGVQKWVQYVSGNDLRFYAPGGGDRLTIQSNGNVGIGTTSPGRPLVVTADAGGIPLRIYRNASTVGWGTGIQWAFNNSSGNVTDYAYVNSSIVSNTAGAENGTLGFFTVKAGTLTQQAIVDQNGNVGIGTTAPSATLHVQGTGRFTGNLTVDGSIAAKYQDVAEWVESSQSLPAGTVVVLDQTRSNQVIASSHAYDTRVAGVVSAQPGITLGEKGESKVLVATTGRVKVRVDATNGPIQVGDLLVTSDIAGVAKKSEPLMLGSVPIHRPGTLIGKALEPLAQGQQCEILVLLSLQ